jgi:hypothetical protein
MSRGEWRGRVVSAPATAACSADLRSAPVDDGNLSLTRLPRMVVWPKPKRRLQGPVSKG